MKKKPTKCHTCKQLIYVKYCTVDDDGKHHSFDDKPAVVTANGTKKWYAHGRKHRDGGLPAQTSKTTERWYVNGKLHRIGAPAQITKFSSTGKVMSADWFFDGVQAIRIHSNKNQVSDVWKSGKRHFVYFFRKKPINLVIIERYEWEDQEVFLCLADGQQKIYFMGGYWKSQD